ncbi:MAG: nitroreductase family protein, partial [Promethearchaeota archaeon]
MMDAIEALLTRKSVRSFTDKPLTEEQIEQLLKVMVAAPSGGNRQPWRIIVVQNQQVKDELAKAALDQHFIATAPVIFAVCRAPEESAARYRD